MSYVDKRHLTCLLKQLNDEYNYVQHEKKQICDLHSIILKKSEIIYRLIYLISNKYLLINDLNCGKIQLNTIINKYTNQANNIQFIESYKLLNQFDFKITELFKWLYLNPSYLAFILVKSEKYIITTQEQLLSVQNLSSIIFNSIYSNCILLEDELLLNKLIEKIIYLKFNNLDLSVVQHQLRKQSCSFSILFKYIIEYNQSIRLYFKTILNEAILDVLKHDEWYLDLDLDKAMHRLTSQDKLNKFGLPQSKDYKTNLNKYRDMMLNKLYYLTNLFIESINNNLAYFPQIILKIFKQLFNCLTKQNNKLNDIKRFFCDLIISLFICPAICNPEYYGILNDDVFVSNIAKYNLTQISHIIQVLSIDNSSSSSNSSGGNKDDDFYSHFKNNTLNDSLNKLIMLYIFNDDCDDYNESLMKDPLIRTTLIISSQDMNNFLIYLNNFIKDYENKEENEFKLLKSKYPYEYINGDKNAKSLEQSNNQIKVIVFNINENGFDCPGMLSEEKVLQEYLNEIEEDDNIEQQQLDDQLLNSDDDDDDADNLLLINNDSNNNSISSSNSQQNINMNINNDENLNCNNDNNVDDDEIINQEIVDGLSDFNFSGHNTPLISGRDTPSSHSHEDNNRRISSISSSINITNNSNSNNNLNNLIQNNLNMFLNSNNNNNSSQSNQQQQQSNNYNNSSMRANLNTLNLPITVNKPNREDINDKFCKFEINSTNNIRDSDRLSEAWSLDADPPESIINEPINDSLIDEHNITLPLNQQKQSNILVIKFF